MKFNTKIEFYNYLLSERNKLVFLIKVLFKCHSESKKPQLICSLSTLVQLFCSKMSSELLEDSNLLLKSNSLFTFAGNIEPYFQSFELKKIQDSALAEIKEFLDNCLHQNCQNYLTYDITSIIKDIVSYLDFSLENFKLIGNQEQLKKNELLFINSILDCLLIEELFLNFVDYQEVDLEQQEYFKEIDECEIDTLESIVTHKIAFAKNKFFKHN